MANPLTLWIDSTNNRLAGGWNSFVFAARPTFKQGDEIQVLLRWIKRPVFANSSMEEILFGDAIIDLEIGNRAFRPVAGRWYLQFDEDNSELLDYNVSAEDLENSLNMVPAIVSAGGVSVTRINYDGYKVVFAEDGTQSVLTGYGEGLSPISDVLVNTITLGSNNTKAVFWVYLRQSIVSEVTSEWETEDAVVAEVQQLKSDIWDIYLTGQPKDGSFSVTMDDGDPFFIPVFATESYVQEIIGEGYSVSKQGDYRWRVTSDDNSAFVLEIDSSENIVSFSGKTATVLLDNAKVAEMLAGITEGTTTLQISVTDAEKRDTILQTPCMVVGNLSL
jgi:hypothetical protein